MVSSETLLVDQQKKFWQLHPPNMEHFYLIFKPISSKFSLHYSKQKHMQLKIGI